MADQRSVEIIINAKDEASKVLKNVHESMSDLSDLMAKSFKNAALISGGALAGLAGGAIASVKAFAEAEKGTKQLEAVLKSTNNAVGITKDALLGMAGELAFTAGVEDDTVVSAQNLLLTFTNIGKKVFPDAMEAVVDMSTALGQDMQSSVIQLGKALNDPIEGVTALKRVGVNFNESQLETIKTLVTSNRVMDAQKLILKELQTEFGGSALAAGQTFAGQLGNLNTAIGNIQESIGALISGALEPYIKNLTYIVSVIGRVLEGTMTADVAIQQFTNSNVLLIQVLGNTIKFFMENKDAAIALAGVIGGVLAIGIIGATAAMAAFIGLSLPALVVFGAIGAGIALLVTHFDQVKSSIAGFVDTMIANIYWLKDNIWTVVGYIIGFMVTLPGKLFLGFGALIINNFDKILSAAQWLLSKLASMPWGDILTNIVKGIANGIIGLIEGAIKGVLSGIPGASGMVKDLKIPRFDDGGYVPSTGLAMVHAGEFVLSRDMLMGRQSTPSYVTNNNGSAVTVNATISSPMDMNLIANRIAWALKNSR